MQVLFRPKFLRVVICLQWSFLSGSMALGGYGLHQPNLPLIPGCRGLNRGQLFPLLLGHFVVLRLNSFEFVVRVIDFATILGAASGLGSPLG